MSLMLNIAKFIAANTSWVMDTDLFVGGDVTDSPAKSVIVREMPGSNKNYSGLEERSIQILVKDLAPVDTETAAIVIFNLLEHKAGFSDANLVGENIFYCDALSMPTILSRDARGSHIFSMTFLVRKP